MHCLEVKNGISKEDIKIFEYTFLGEVRILGALRHHKSIVKIYGHHFSSTWVPSSEGNKEYQVFQSAIIMEYIKGGSLKVETSTNIIIKFPILNRVLKNWFYVELHEEIVRKGREASSP